MYVYKHVNNWCPQVAIVCGHSSWYVSETTRFLYTATRVVNYICEASCVKLHM